MENQQAPAASGQYTFLHVGCGPLKKDRTTQGFNDAAWREIRLDIDAQVHPDIVGTMLDMKDVASASVDAIYSCHNIEHLVAHEVPLAFKEFHRVLNDAGFLVIACPDLQAICALVAEDKLTQPAYQSEAGPIAPIDMLYGHRRFLAGGNDYMAHRCGFTKTVLQGTLIDCGFKSVIAARRLANFDLWAIASKLPMSEDQLRSLGALHFPH